MSLPSLLVRPFAIALGIYILVNLFLTLENSQLATTEIWLNVHMPEPWGAVFAGILGMALLVPHGVGVYPSARWFLGGIYCGFCILTAATAVNFYHGVGNDRILSDFPLPLSVVIFLILLMEFSRMWWWTGKAPRLPAPARVFVAASSVFVAFLLVALTHVVLFGRTDFSRPADAAVIFGAKVEHDGTPSPALRDRLNTGIALFRNSYVDYLIMTGGTDANGTVEPDAMLNYAVAAGVPPDRIFCDEEGYNTLASARNCRRIASERGFANLLAVTQYFHCARVKLLFARQGLTCYTVPTTSRVNDQETTKLKREAFFLLRETFAFPFYFLFYRV